jgi:hypothetical protein
MSVPSSIDFLARFPEFGELLGTVVSGALEEAGRSTPETVWGARHTEAVSQLAAHLLATRTIQIGSQVGSPSGSPSGDLLLSTLYGQEYRRLLDSLPLSGFVV